MDFKLMIITPLTFRYAVTEDCEELITPDKVDYLAEVHGYYHRSRMCCLFPGAAYFDSNKALLDFYYTNYNVVELMREARVLEDTIRVLRRRRSALKDDTVYTEYDSQIAYDMDMKNTWHEILWGIAAYNCVIFIINFTPITPDSEHFAGTAYIDDQMQHMRRTQKLVVA